MGGTESSINKQPWKIHLILPPVLISLFSQQFHEKYYCSVTQSCLTLCSPMDCSTPGLPVPHHLSEFAQVHVHCISDAFQPSNPQMPSSPSALSVFLENTLLIFPLGRCENNASKGLNNLLKVIELTITGYLYTKPGAFPPLCSRLLLRLNPMPWLMSPALGWAMILQASAAR